MGTMNAMIVPLDDNGIDNHNALATPKYVENRSLAANTAKTVTPPAGAKWVSLTGTGSFFVRWDGGPAAVPAADITDGGSAELVPVPTLRKLDGVSTFSLISSGAVQVQLAYYN